MKSLFSFIALFMLSTSVTAGVISSESDSRLSGASIIDIEPGIGCQVGIGDTYNGAGFSIHATNLREYCSWTNFGSSGLANPNSSPFTITFDNTISAFGFELGAVNRTFVSLSLFDTQGDLLESFSIANASINPNFFGGFGSSIKSISVSVDYSIIDGLRFVSNSTPSSVPEPGTLAIFAVALLGIAARRKQK